MGSRRVNVLVMLTGPYPLANPATIVTAPDPAAGNVKVATPVVASIPTRDFWPPVTKEAATRL